jgi:hypothetical protein
MNTIVPSSEVRELTVAEIDVVSGARGVNDYIYTAVHIAAGFAEGMAIGVTSFVSHLAGK